MGAIDQLRRIKAATRAVARQPRVAIERARRELRPVYRGRGTCPICERAVRFKALDPWFRDHLLCSGCGSIPRERALMQVIADWSPRWKEASVHESSPGERGTSVKLARECAHYVASQYDPSTPWGEMDPTGQYRSEDLEHQTFADESFDLVVTQDVFEHIFDIDAAFREIARTLKPGGAHIFTTPLVNGREPSEPWARRRDDGTIDHLQEPEYHGNPMDHEGGSLVTWHYGYDIVDQIREACGLDTTIVLLDDLSRGLQAEYLEVLVTQKP
ncbi:MAG: class I SAM-dependent methyltransferase [Phycisphaerales bacterium]|nr:class I SAM-dependent methyltransferase [Phycisphaerales bacterium]